MKDDDFTHWAYCALEAFAAAAADIVADLSLPYDVTLDPKGCESEDGAYLLPILEVGGVTVHVERTSPTDGVVWALGQWVDGGDVRELDEIDNYEYAYMAAQGLGEELARRQFAGSVDFHFGEGRGDEFMWPKTG